MRNTIFSKLLKIIARGTGILAILFFSLGTASTGTAQAGTASEPIACGQLLAEAEARFLSTLAPDGSVLTTPEAKAAADEYIRVSKLCYDEIGASNAAGTVQEETPIFIDEGGILLGDTSVAEFNLTGGKWGSPALGTPGGTVTYSFMGTGLNLSAEPNSSKFGTSVALTSLPGFQTCFITKIQNAFAAWEAVSNIRFVQVNDSGGAFGAAGATGDIRIGAHTFDGPSSILAHAYFPVTNGNSGTGDMHFDRAENWACNNNGLDIGVVALHEIGHSLGLDHEKTNAVAIMDPYYNSSLTMLQTDDINGATTLYGVSPLAAPLNDDFNSATLINSIAYSNSIDVRSATESGDDPNPINPCSSTRGIVSLRPGWKTVWYKYTPQRPESISLDTLGSNYDTFIAVWTGTRGALSLVQCNDDVYEAIQSELSFIGAASTTYYMEVGEFSGETSDQEPWPKSPNGSLEFHAFITNTEITAGGSLLGRYYVPVNGSERRSFYNVDKGPVKVASTTNDAIIASERINLMANPSFNSYAEVMGLPASKLSDTHTFPWYNNTGFLDSQLRFGNVGNAPTTVTIKIGGTARPETFTLAPNESARVSFTGVDSGPVEVKSSGGQPIIAALRINLKTGSPFTSYSEFLGLSASSTLSTRYIFPWYNNTGLLDSQLRFGNVGGAPTTVTIKIAGAAQAQTYTLAPNQSTRISYPLDNGPVEVISSGGVPITAALRINLKNNTAFTSYTELMGLTGATLTDTRYIFPWYNNTGLLDSQLRFGNVGSSNTTVSIKVHGVVQPQTYNLAPNQSTRVSLPGVDNGPVEVYSSGNVPIIAALRINLKANTSFDSYYEFMGMSVGSPLGLPGNQLSTTYWFPWYNNSGLLDSQLRFGIP